MDVVGCYAQSLSLGHTLLCKNIKASTITAYIDAVSSFFTSHPYGLKDPTARPTGTGKTKLIAKVISEHRRWETMPNRREPVTKSMLIWIITTASLYPTSSLQAALADWAILAIHFGLRLSEFLQTQDNINRKKIQRNLDGRPQAFILTDVQFFGQGKQLLHLDHAKVIDPTQIESFSLTWRYQKNLQNGEHKLMTRNDTNPKLCTVRAILRICHRAAFLRNHNIAPLAIYQSPNGHPAFISHKHMENIIRLAAYKTYKIKRKCDLARFSCHSLRVGACVMLHIAGFSTDSIKFELRWRSDSFRDYLRNVVSIAAAKSTALTKFDPDKVNF